MKELATTAGRALNHLLEEIVVVHEISPPRGFARRTRGLPETS
jgi:hypothetical protein